MNSLIYDRTAADVARVKTLKTRVRNGIATLAENEEWLSSLKGSYNYTDLNRVGRVMNELAALLNEYGYINNVSVPQSWSENSKPNNASMTNYLTQLNNLKNAFNYIPNSPQIPSNMVSLTYEEANDIEKILYWLGFAIFTYMNNFAYSGVGLAGQEKIWQKRFRNDRQWNSQPYKLSQYAENDTWRTISFNSNSAVAKKTTKLQLDLPQVTDGIYQSITGWNKAINTIDSLAGVIE